MWVNMRSCLRRRLHKAVHSNNVCQCWWRDRWIITYRSTLPLFFRIIITFKEVQILSSSLLLPSPPCLPSRMCRLMAAMSSGTPVRCLLAGYLGWKRKQITLFSVHFPSSRYKLQITRYKWKITNFKLQITNHKLQHTWHVYVPESERVALWTRSWDTVWGPDVDKENVR